VKGTKRARGRILGGLAGAAVAAVACLAAFTASGTAAHRAVPQNTVKPSIDGVPNEGNRLAARHGQWTGDPNRFDYQWLRCDANGANCFQIQGATDREYVLTSADVGHTIVVRVRAYNSDGFGTAWSPHTGVVQGAGTAPNTSSQPTITGTTVVGNWLTGHPNSWNGARPMTFRYTWTRCRADGSGCFDTGVHNLSYHLGNDDVGHRIRFEVTATNRYGSATAISDPTAVIQAVGSPPPPPPPSQCMPVANVSLPAQLLVDRISYTPSSITNFNDPLVAKFHVVSTRGGCVTGALVYAVGVPFNRLSQGQEVATDGSGWATITFRVLPTFSLRRGNLVVIFVRARKPGENVLAGVSSRRLVSVRVG
jgi:hypothetical protein